MLNTIVLACVIVLQFVVIVLLLARVAKLECYVLAKVDPSVYLTTTIPALTPKQTANQAQSVEASEESQAMIEYNRLILGDLASPQQIKRHEARYGTKEDVLA